MDIRLGTLLVPLLILGDHAKLRASIKHAHHDATYQNFSASSGVEMNTVRDSAKLRRLSTTAIKLTSMASSS